MNDPALVDSIAKIYYARFGYNSTEENAVNTLSKEFRKEEKEIESAIKMVQGLVGACYQELRKHYENRMSGMNDPYPELKALFSGYPISTEAQEQIITQAERTITK